MLRHPDVERTLTCISTSLAGIMRAEVVILDTKANIITATVSSDKNYAIGQIYNLTLKRKELIVVKNPGFDELCTGCPRYGTCSELIELSCPIMINDTCIGIISVTCFEAEQRSRILKRLDAYTEFLTEMSFLIASRTQEVEAKEKLHIINSELYAIMNTVDECIIVLDIQNRITFCNKLAEKLLCADTKDLIGRPFSMFCHAFKDGVPSSLNEKQEMDLYTLQGRLKSTYMRTNRIVSEGSKTETIVMIEEKQKVTRFVSTFISNSPISDDINIISAGSALDAVKARAKMVSATDSTVLIRGESGTGKEVFARAIHSMSARASKPFIALNCASIPDTLLESELFGYEAGAFTGAKKGGKPGYFELADTGTLFLDEIGDMPIHLQSKILRVLQEKHVLRVGGTREKKVDIRVIAATNRDLEKMVAESSFREDLFYRLNVIPLNIPPLRERGSEDILALINYFVKKYSAHFGKNIEGLSDEVREILTSYPWPGNVRELENAVEYMLNMEYSPFITVESLPEKIRKSADNAPAASSSSLKEQIAGYEKEIIRNALDRYGRTKSGKDAAARELNIGIASLYRKIKEYNIDG